MDKLVSLVIPCYNGECYLPETLNSIRNQTYPRLQIIIADDESTDGSYQILVDFQQSISREGYQTKLVRCKHGGQASAISKGLQLVRGDYLMWMDADDCLMPNAVSDLVRWLQENPGFRMVRSDGYLYQVADGTKALYTKPWQKVCGSVFEGVLSGEWPCMPGSYLMETSLFRECYPDMHIVLSPEGQNYQMILPPASRVSCGYIDEPLMVYNIHEGSHSMKKRSFQQQKQRIENFKKLRLELLPLCQCDQEEFRVKTEQYYQKECMALYREVAERARKDRQ